MRPRLIHLGLAILSGQRIAPYNYVEQQAGKSGPRFASEATSSPDRFPSGKQLPYCILSVLWGSDSDRVFIEVWWLVSLTRRPRPEIDPNPKGASAERNHNEPVLVAVDLGAESCRISLLRWDHGKPSIEVVHRFSNNAIDQGNGLRWDIQNICAGVEDGLRACAALVPAGIAAVGVDGWAVDLCSIERPGPALHGESLLLP